MKVEKEIVLRLTEREAGILMDLFGNVSGKGPGRILTDQLLKLLTESGIYAVNAFKSHDLSIESEE